MGAERLADKSETIAGGRSTRPAGGPARVLVMWEGGREEEGLRAGGKAPSRLRRVRRGREMMARKTLVAPRRRTPVSARMRTS